ERPSPDQGEGSCPFRQPGSALHSFDAYPGPCPPRPRPCLHPGPRGGAGRGLAGPERAARVGGAGREFGRRTLLGCDDRSGPGADRRALRVGALELPRHRRRPRLPASHGARGRCGDASRIRGRHDAPDTARRRSGDPEARNPARRRFHPARSRPGRARRHRAAGRSRRVRGRGRRPERFGARLAPNPAGVARDPGGRKPRAGRRRWRAPGRNVRGRRVPGRFRRAHPRRRPRRLSAARHRELVVGRADVPDPFGLRRPHSGDPGRRTRLLDRGARRRFTQHRGVPAPGADARPGQRVRLGGPI
ncbi:MAG: Trypsin-like serine proteases, typically periplasmic, contain C-terminal PDZ domain, partial [uncultured Microvirga sp.]